MPYKNKLTATQQLQRNQNSKRRYHKDREKHLARRRELYVQNNGVEYARKQREKYGPEYTALLNKRYRSRHPEKVAAITKSYKDKVRATINAFKLEKGCVDCGFNKHPAALDFDHIYGNKAGNVSQYGSVEAAMREAEKCVVRCSNCHRIATSERRKGRKQ